jgi:hypothetical protein
VCVFETSPFSCFLLSCIAVLWTCGSTFHFDTDPDSEPGSGFGSFPKYYTCWKNQKKFVVDIYSQQRQFTLFNLSWRHPERHNVQYFGQYRYLCSKFSLKKYSLSLHLVEMDITHQAPDRQVLDADLYPSNDAGPTEPGSKTLFYCGQVPYGSPQEQFPLPTNSVFYLLYMYSNNWGLVRPGKRS